MQSIETHQLVFILLLLIHLPSFYPVIQLYHLDITFIRFYYQYILVLQYYKQPFPLRNNMTKNLRIMDFRNAKYQGHTHLQTMQGFGLLLDEKYTLIMAEWQGSSIIGDFVIFFSDSTIAYGNINKAIVSITQNNIIYTHPSAIMSKDTFYIMENTDLSLAAKIELSPQKNHDNNSQKIIDEQIYDGSNRISVISTLLGTQLQEEYKSFIDFIMVRFKNKHEKLLEIYHSSKQFRVSFRGESLFIQLNRNSHGAYKVTSVGYTGNQSIENQRKTLKDKNAEIGRKYVYLATSKWLIEQYITAEPITFIEFEVQHKLQKAAIQHENNRPRQCIKSLREYFKISLNFINQYIKLQQIYLIKNTAVKCSQEIQIGIVSKQAQIKLESRNVINQDDSAQPSNFTYLQEVTIDQVKKEIQRARSKSKKASYSQISSSMSPTKYPKYQQSSVNEVNPYTYKNRKTQNYGIQSKSPYQGYHAQSYHKSKFSTPKKLSYYEELNIPESPNKSIESFSPNRDQNSHSHLQSYSINRIKKRYLISEEQQENNYQSKYKIRREPQYPQEIKNQEIKNLSPSYSKSNNLNKLMNDYRKIQNEISVKSYQNSRHTPTKSPNRVTRYNYLEHVEPRRKKY